MKASTLVTALLLALAAASLASRFVPVPFGLYTVASGSMEPSIRVLDLALVFGRGFAAGDVVVWCTSPVYCVIHRVVNVSGGYVVTKGDANPVPDPKVPRGYVRGRVVLVVPRELWLTALAIYAAYAVARNRRAIAALTGILALYLPLLAYSALVFSAALLVAPQTSLYTALPKPDAHLARAEFIDLGRRCAVGISYYMENIQVKEVLAARVYGVEARVLESTPTYVLLEVPEEAYALAVATGRLNVSIEAELTRAGHLRGSYAVVVPLEKLEVYVANGSLVVVNRNCLPFTVNVTWMYAEAVGRPWKYLQTSVTLGRGIHVLEPPEAPYVYADVRYTYLGSEVYYRLEVRRAWRGGGS